MNELVIVRILAEHLSSVSSPPLRNLLLIILFHPTSIETSPYVKNASTSLYNKLPLLNNSYGRGGGVSNPYTTIGYYGGSAGALGPPNTGGTGGGMIPGHSYNQNNGQQQQYSKVSYRLNILATLTSLAIASNNGKVLDSVAVWMQVGNFVLDSLKYIGCRKVLSYKLLLIMLDKYTGNKNLA